MIGTSIAFRLEDQDEPFRRAERITSFFNDARSTSYLTAKQNGPYVNFEPANANYYKAALEQYDTSYWRVVSDKTILIETAPENIGESYSVLHLRAAVLANALKNINQEFGYNTRFEYFWNDCGTPAGKLISVYEMHGNPRALSLNPSKELGRLVRFCEETSPSSENLMKEGAHYALQIEKRDPIVTEKWEKLRDMQRNLIFARNIDLGIAVDKMRTESYHLKNLDAIQSALLKRGIAYRNRDGSVAVKFHDETIPFGLLFKRDGGSLYLVRDLAELLKRVDEGFQDVYYIVSKNQANHFRQLFALAKLATKSNIDHFKHIPFGFVYSDLEQPDQILSKLEMLVKQWSEQQNVSLKGHNIRSLCIVALKLFLLSKSRTLDIDFRTMRLEAMKANKSIYTLFTLLRAKHVIDGKASDPSKNLVALGEQQFENLKDQGKSLIERIDLLRLFMFEALTKLDPYKLVDYSSNLAKLFNSYAQSSGLMSGGDLTVENQLITKKFISVIEKVFELLALEPTSNK